MQQCPDAQNRDERSRYRGLRTCAFLMAVGLLFGDNYRLFAGSEGEAEEPDYFFLTGGPYTQGKHSPQLIWANHWSRDQNRNSRSYLSGGRFEYGITHRWEADVEFGAASLLKAGTGSSWQRHSGFTDALIGARYRLLDEINTPLTLTLGPQLIIPVSRSRSELGHGQFGYAFDLTAAKDWGGTVFVAASLNTSWTPGVSLGNDSGPDVDLTEISWGAAFCIRALENTTASRNEHDIHLFLELGGSYSDSVEAAALAKSDETVIAPGIRYGFINSGGTLSEFGLAVPIGISRDAPAWGLILQFQIEWPGVEY